MGIDVTDYEMLWSFFQPAPPRLDDQDCAVAAKHSLGNCTQTFFGRQHCKPPEVGIFHCGLPHG